MNCKNILLLKFLNLNPECIVGGMSSYFRDTKSYKISHSLQNKGTVMSQLQYYSENLEFEKFQGYL